MAHLKRSSTPRTPVAPPPAPGPTSTTAALTAPIVDVRGTAVTIDIEPLVESGRKLVQLISRRTTTLRDEAHRIIDGPGLERVPRPLTTLKPQRLPPPHTRSPPTHSLTHHSLTTPSPPK